MRPAIRKAFAFLALISFPFFLQAQIPTVPGNPPSSEKKEKKPYKILTAGKTITIRSNVNLKNLMIWTSRGNRVVEQKNIDKQEFSFTSTINENIFFILMELENGRRYTEKIGM